MPKLWHLLVSEQMKTTAVSIVSISDSWGGAVVSPSSNSIKTMAETKRWVVRMELELDSNVHPDDFISEALYDILPNYDDEFIEVSYICID
jgi:hypothetical protein